MGSGAWSCRGEMGHVIGSQCFKVPSHELGFMGMCLLGAPAGGGGSGGVLGSEQSCQRRAVPAEVGDSPPNSG